MTPHDVKDVVDQWLLKAREDLLAAKHLLALAQNAPCGIVCYHAQQCVEKSVKAVLTAGGVDFPKTHDIAELVASLPKGADLGISANHQDLLTDYATTTRYPGEAEPILFEDAARALEVAETTLKVATRLTSPS